MILLLKSTKKSFNFCFKRFVSTVIGTFAGPLTGLATTQHQAFVLSLISLIFSTENLQKLQGLNKIQQKDFFTNQICHLYKNTAFFNYLKIHGLISIWPHFITSRQSIINGLQCTNINFSPTHIKNNVNFMSILEINEVENYKHKFLNQKYIFDPYEKNIQMTKYAIDCRQPQPDGYFSFSFNPNFVINQGFDVKAGSIKLENYSHLHRAYVCLEKDAIITPYGYISSNQLFARKKAYLLRMLNFNKEGRVYQEINDIFSDIENKNLTIEQKLINLNDKHINLLKEPLLHYTPEFITPEVYIPPVISPFNVITPYSLNKQYTTNQIFANLIKSNCSTELIKNIIQTDSCFFKPHFYEELLKIII